MRIYFDIDGTLTIDQARNSPPDEKMVCAARKLIAAGHDVVLWSGGKRYARKMAEKMGLSPLACLGKPEVIVENERDIWLARLDRCTVSPAQFMANAETPEKLSWRK